MGDKGQKDKDKASKQKKAKQKKKQVPVLLFLRRGVLVLVAKAGGMPEERYTPRDIAKAVVNLY